MTLLQLTFALALLLGAAWSDFVGQCAVLFLNRVSPRRFLLCLLTGTLVFFYAAFVWAVGLWLGSHLFGLGLSAARCFWLVALAHTPLLLGFLALMPHFGTYLFHGLRAWVFFNLVVAVGWETGASLPAAILSCLPGWLWHLSLTHLRLVRLERLQSGLWRLLAGRA